ncbi:TolC family protein [Hydrogenophaga sp.]|uniref:TolC family protein n=1 Tax=Hydrogenophaga sp. TaxID=1904254 RepID=UPI002ABC06AE|nr:TolC family protein [Hydrogenophaga sp.]MDZ4396961.1 TolC family protein [Hydrogenophaga sp.]
MEHPSLFLARAVLALAGLLADLPTAAADDPLSLNAAVSAAVARSRSLDASAAAAQGAREMAVAAAQRPDPVLRLSLDNLPVDGPERFSTTRDFMTMRSIALMQTLPNADKRRARGERFEREAEAAMSERALRVAQLQTEVAQAWLERRMQEQRWALLQAQISEARVLVQTTEAALRGGRGSTADALDAREALAQLEQGLIGARAERTNARLTLARFTGGPPDQPLADPPTMRQTTAAVGEAYPWLNLPDLAALQAREAVARAEAEVARQELQPDWSAEIMFSQRGSAFSNMVSIGVSVPLQWDKPQRQQRELAARLARVNELEAEREEQIRERALQVQRGRQDWQAGQARLAHLDAQRHPLATQRIEVALAAYRGGREGLGAVLQARRDALNLALERLALERDTAGLWSQLEYLIPDSATGVKP